jgi:hypothetical protein
MTKINVIVINSWIRWIAQKRSPIGIHWKVLPFLAVARGAGMKKI